MRGYLVIANSNAGGVDRRALDAAVGVLAAATGAAARLGLARAPRAGTHLDRDDARHLRGASVRISGAPVPEDADGELRGELTTRRYRVLPGAWSLLGAPAPGGGPA
jgi:YegS C-terminal NAD kinase beta sandwich-like domain